MIQSKRLGGASSGVQVAGVEEKLHSKLDHVMLDLLYDPFQDPGSELNISQTICGLGAEQENM